MVSKQCPVVGATEFYKELADQTGGAYVKFSNFSVITDMFYGRVIFFNTLRIN